MFTVEQIKTILSLRITFGTKSSESKKYNSSGFDIKIKSEDGREITIRSSYNTIDKIIYILGLPIIYGELSYAESAEKYDWDNLNISDFKWHQQCRDESLLLKGVLSEEMIISIKYLYSREYL